MSALGHHYGSLWPRRHHVPCAMEWKLRARVATLLRRNEIEPGVTWAREGLEIVAYVMHRHAPRSPWHRVLLWMRYRASIEKEGS